MESTPPQMEIQDDGIVNQVPNDDLLHTEEEKTKLERINPSPAALFVVGEEHPHPSSLRHKLRSFATRHEFAATL